MSGVISPACCTVPVAWRRPRHSEVAPLGKIYERADSRLAATLQLHTTPGVCGCMGFEIRQFDKTGQLGRVILCQASLSHPHIRTSSLLAYAAHFVVKSSGMLLLLDPVVDLSFFTLGKSILSSSASTHMVSVYRSVVPTTR